MKLIERTVCPFCKNKEFKNLFSMDYANDNLKHFLNSYYKNNYLNEILANEEYILSKCYNCNGIFQKKVPDSNFSNYIYDELITSKTSFEKKKNYVFQNNLKLQYDFNLIQELSKKKDKIKILEFGCGWGYWAKFMQSKSMIIKTCEFSKKRNDFLLENNIENFQDLNQINDEFDIIYSEEVLEHLINPLDDLKNLSKLLKPGGFMYHRFPSSKFFELKLKFRYIPRKDCAHPLEHINIFNKKCFQKISDILNLKKINLNNLKNFDPSKKMKFIKNNYLFNFIILRK